MKTTASGTCRASRTGSVVVAARRRSSQNTKGATSPHAYQRGSVQARAFCQVRPAKYSCVAKKMAMAVQRRNTPKPIANLRPSDAGRPMPESICEVGVVANLTATFVHS